MSARRRFVLAGLAGMVAAAILSIATWFASALVAPVITAERAGGTLLPRLVLLGLGFVAVAELPLMLILLIRLSRGTREGERLLNLTHLAYVAFPAVYGLLGATLTGERWWVLVMLALSALRLMMSLIGVHVPPPERGAGLDRRR